MGRLSTVLTRDGEVIKVNLSKTKAIKLKCLDCSGFDRSSVKECVIEDCELYPYRLGKNPHTSKQRNNNMKLHCVNCSGGNKPNIKRCTVETCPLYYHRIGAKKID